MSCVCPKRHYKVEQETMMTKTAITELRAKSISLKAQLFSQLEKQFRFMGQKLFVSPQR